MIIQILFLVLGLGVLVISANWLVSGASGLAKKYSVPDLAIGLTIVAFGTSAPEMVVNLIATISNHHDIVYGNVLGSNNFNLFVILGVAAMITPLKVQTSTVWKEMMFTSKKENLDRWEAGLLFLMYAGYTVFLISKEI